MGLVVNSKGIVQHVFDPIQISGAVRVAYYSTVTSIGVDGTVNARTSTGLTSTFTPAEDCVYYNCSQVYSASRGEKVSGVRVGDMITGYLDMYGEAKVVFILSRDTGSIAWNTQRQYSTAAKETTREPVDGWYVYELLVGNKLQTVKTKDKELANKIDSYDGAFGVTVKDGIVINAMSVGLVKNVDSSGVNGWDVIGMDGRKVTLCYTKPGSETYTGMEKQVTLSKNIKIYDVSPTAQSYGKEVQLQLGDRVRTYLDEKENVIYAYVLYHATRAAGTEAYCDHCGQIVHWEPWSGGSFSVKCTHYYLNTNLDKQIGNAVGSSTVDCQVVLDLNGKTLTVTGNRAFTIHKDDSLTILDSVGGGTIVAGGEKLNGGVFSVQAGGTLNLLAGTAKGTVSAGYKGSVVYVVAGGTVNIGGSAVIDGSGMTLGEGAGGSIYTSGTVNILGGEVKGGSVGSGGSIFVNAGVLTISGGKISGGQAANFGDDIFVNNPEAVVTVSGGEVSGQFQISDAKSATVSGAPKLGELKLGKVKITLGALTEGADIVVAASGAFAEPSDSASAYAAYFRSKDSTKQVFAIDDVLTLIEVYYADCAHCNENVLWMPWKATYTESGHYFLEKDVARTVQYTPAGKDMVLDLNGKTFNTEGSRAIMVNNGITVTIIDTVGTGMITASGTENGGIFSVKSGGTLNFRGGTAKAIVAPDTQQGSVAYVIAGGTLNISGGVLDASAIQNGKGACGAVYSSGTLLISGGVSSTTDGSGDDIYVLAATAVTLADCSVAQEAHINAATTATLSGDVVLTRLKLSDGVLLTLGELTGNADVTVAVSGGAFTVENENAAAYLEAGYIKSANADQTWVVVNNVIKVQDPNAPKCAHCGLYMDEINWLPYNAGSIKSTGGHYYLTAEFSRTQQLQIEAGIDSVIDLRGNNFTVTKANVRAFLVYGTLSIMDTVGEGVVTGLGNGNGGVYNVQSGAKLYLYGGTSTAGTDAGYGSVVYLENAELTVDGSAVLNGNGKTGSTVYANVKDGNGSTVVINGGTVRAGYAKGFGGNIYVSDKSQLTISGGIVGGGEADLDASEKNGLGGNIYLASGAQASLTSGNVQNGKAAGYGGNIAIASGAQMEITGGFIKNGTANTAGKLTAGLQGDNIYTEGTLTLRHGSFTLNNTDYPGNAVLARGSATVNIHGNATDYGEAISGNIHMLSTCTLNADFGAQMIYRYSRIGWYRTAAEAIADFGNHENHRYVKLMYAEDITVDKDLYLDVNGLQVNVTVNEGCTLMGVDSTATLETAGTGCAIISGEGTVAAEADRGSLGRYAALTRDGKTTFHRFEMALTAVSLRTSAVGFYYKAKCTCDPILAAAVDTYGVVLCVNNVPGKDFVTETGDINQYTVMNGDTFVSGQVTTSGAVFGIMKDTLDAATNKARGEIKIYANAYVNFLADGVAPQTVMADNSNAGLKNGDANFDGIGYSLYDIMKKMDEKYADLTEAQQASLTEFYNTWGVNGMGQWGLTNFGTFYVGFGRSNITPDFNVYISGGNVPSRISTEVKDELSLTCVAITDENGATALLITQDLVNAEIGYSTRQKIAEATGVPFKNIMISATHTHSAPGTAGDYQGVAEYQTLYYEAAVAAAKAAMADRAPATAQTGSTTARTESDQQLVFVRRYKQLDGGYRGGVGNNTNSPLIAHAYEANETMQVIKFVRSGSKKDILLTNLGAHATFNGATTQTGLSADFPGAIRNYIETNSDCLSAHFISGAADQNPTTELSWEDHGFDYVAYGQAVAKVALGAALTDVETGNIAFASQIMTVDSNKADVDQATLEKAQQANAVFLADGFAAGDAKAVELGFIGIYHARSFITRSALEDTQDIGINALAIGDLSFVFAPYEMFGSNAAALVAGSPYQNTFVVTCANDSKGYVPADNAYDMGCYESYIARVARGSAETLVEGFLSLLSTLHG